MLTTEFLEKYGVAYVEGTMKPNLKDIPVTNFTPTIDNAKKFNSIYKKIKKEDPRPIVRTHSGGISIKNFYLPSYDLKLLKTKNGSFKGVELIAVFGTFMFRLHFTSRPHTLVSGNRAFVKFIEICKQFGVDLKQYEVSKEEGLAIKETIPKPFIKLELDSFIDRTFENVHHIDWHSSYPAGLVNKFPEFEKPIKYLYEKRNKNKSFKDVLNCSIGFMQSEYCNYRLALLSHDAIVDNNERIEKLASIINNSKDRVVLLYNTDGFWYKGPIYHGDGEGDDIGQWHNDHTNCKLRIKSSGAYEYIEDGKYHPVLRGLTNFDKIKDREDWKWGDIYRDECKPIIFSWDDEKGVVAYEEK